MSPLCDAKHCAKPWTIRAELRQPGGWIVVRLCPEHAAQFEMDVKAAADEQNADLSVLEQVVVGDVLRLRAEEYRGGRGV